MDITSELERLTRMRDGGALTEAEFHTAKTQLLAAAASPAVPAAQAGQPALPPPSNGVDPPVAGSPPSAPSSYPLGPPPQWQPPMAPSAWDSQQAGGGATFDASIPHYYHQKFAELDAKGGGFNASWNWPAFLFGAIWYLVRGMWAKALILFAVALLSGGFLVIPIWIYGGIAGNYDYYLLKRKGTQLWA